MADDAKAALGLADETLEWSRAHAAVPVPAALLHRVRGSALARLGETAAAREALEHALEVGRARNVDYEVALTLRALAACSPGGQDALVSQSDELLARLGVVSVQEIV
jgi:hypothetical protein